MIAWISTWAGGIVVSIIIATLIELIIPNGNNKKYVKTIIGLFILFSIIGPVISKFTNVSIGQSFNTDLLADAKKYNNTNPEMNTNSNIETLYKTNLEKDITEKLKIKGYNIFITALSINFVEGENYGKINKLYIRVNKVTKETEDVKASTSNSIKEVDKIEINIKNNSIPSETEGLENISETTKDEIKEYLSNEYKINKEDIGVN